VTISDLKDDDDILLPARKEEKSEAHTGACEKKFAN